MEYRSFSRILLLISIAVLAATRCGQPPPEAPQGGGGNGPNLTQPGDTESQYSWDDPDCVAGSKLGASFSSAVLTSWQSSAPAQVETRLGELIDSKGLFRDNVLKGKVTARDQYARNCSDKSNAPNCKDESGKDIFAYSSAKEGIVPRFCRSSGEYSRDSIERVALASGLALKNALSFAAAAYKISIPAIQLKVLPSFVTKWNSAKVSSNSSQGSIVQNLAYFAASGNLAPFIAVFPRRAGSTDDTPRLWETPFAISHELGHHMERVLGVDHFGANTVSLVRMGVSEAFADLNGFASLNLDDSTIKNFPCQGVDRAVSSGNFQDGTAKVFDETMVKILEQLSSSVRLFAGNHQSLGCEGRLNRTSIHGVGAIIAYNVHKMFDLTFEAAGLSADQKPKAYIDALTKWVRQVEKSLGVGKSPRNDLTGVARSLETAVQETLAAYKVPITSTLSTVLCEHMQLAFDGTGQKHWFGQTSCKSN